MNDHHLIQSTIQPFPKSPSLFAIRSDDGTELLAILSDGTVRGTIENAGPAAQMFMTELRGLTEAIASQAKAEALREAAEVWGAGLGLAAFAEHAVEDDVSAVQATVKWLDERANELTP